MSFLPSLWIKGMITRGNVSWRALTTEQGNVSIVRLKRTYQREAAKFSEAEEGLPLITWLRKTILFTRNNTILIFQKKSLTIDDSFRMLKCQSFPLYFLKIFILHLGNKCCLLPYLKNILRPSLPRVLLDMN